MARITLSAERFGTEASEAEYRGLETGDLLYFPESPPLVSDEDRAFLVTQKQVDAAYHKNVSYRPQEDRLKGVDQDDPAQRARVHAIMRDYSRRAIAFMLTLLNRYAAAWKVDYASFRPIEEEGRQVSLHSRNDLLHFDSFPTRPSHGDRLLRIFTNIHPERGGSGSRPMRSRPWPAGSPTGSACTAGRARWRPASTWPSAPRRGWACRSSTGRRTTGTCSGSTTP